jgi:cystathionine beta-synthase
MKTTNNSSKSQGNVLDAIGNTPLAKLPLKTPAAIFAKLEYLNPGGSIKDRTALYMVEDAERRGLLEPGGTIIEASSGNQGIALAMIGAVKGYKVAITVSEKVSQEKKQTLQAYGAKLVICPATEHHNDPQNYHVQAVALQKRTPGAWMPNQYFNTANPESHYLSLGPEIWQQTGGEITHYFAAAGTGGQISGVGRYLKEQNPAIKVIAVDSAESFHATGGQPKPYALEGIGIDFTTPCLDETVIDEFINVKDVDAIAALRLLASSYGLLVGPSSGAVAHAVLSYQKHLTKNDLAVMIFSDSGRAYLSKNFYEEPAN